MTTPTRDSRWLALVVLCAGMLMVILDQTIVNVALPTIQEDLGFSAAGLAWVVNAYLIAFGGLLLLAGRLGDLIGRRSIFLVGLAVFTLASLLCGLSGSPEMLIAARFVQGVGGALSSAVILGMIVTMFPTAGRAGEGDRHLQLRRLGRRVDRPPGRRRSDPGARLALDLLRQRADRARRVGLRVAADRARARSRPQRRRRPSRRGPRDRRADARRLHDRRRALDPARRVVGRAARRVRLAPGDRGEAAPAPRHPALAQRRRREPHPDADGRRHARRLLPRRALPAADPRLQRRPHRRRVPPDLAVHRRALRRLLGALERPLRPARRAPAGLGRRSLAGLVLLARVPVDGQLRRRHPARDAAARHRRRPHLPGPDDARDVRRRARGLGPRLRPREHDPAGRRRPRSRGAGDGRVRAHRRGDRRRRAA